MTEPYSSQREYDSHGRIVRLWDTNGYWARWQYDSDGRLMEWSNSKFVWGDREYGGAKVWYAYHPNGQISCCRDNSGNETRFDPNGKLEEE